MIEEIEPFYVVGIGVNTTNENGKSIVDMGTLWGRFFNERISQKMPYKTSNEIYSLFTAYESDYRGAYLAVIGHRVKNLDTIPTGFIGIEIAGGTYQKITAKGKMPDAIVDSWREIWANDSVMNRAYSTDFEVYGKKSNNGDASEVDIFVSIKK